MKTKWDEVCYRLVKYLFGSNLNLHNGYSNLTILSHIALLYRVQDLHSQFFFSVVMESGSKVPEIRDRRVDALEFITPSLASVSKRWKLLLL